jgi:Ni/Co efflux regulator RcnB
MKTTLLSATALALILSVPAFAAPDDHHGGGGHGDHAAPPAHTDVTPPPGGGAMHGAPHDAHHDHPGRGDANHGGTPPAGGNTVVGPNPFVGGDTHRGHNNNTGADTHRGGHDNNSGNGGNGGASFTHAGRGHNSAFDSLRRAFNAPHHYRYRGSYNRPNGWYAHRWTFGEFLPALFFGSSYWINDYGYYDLAAPPPGTVWVRYGDDALLIDRYSGEVIQVEYGIFY